MGACSSSNFKIKKKVIVRNSTHINGLFRDMNFNDVELVQLSTGSPFDNYEIERELGEGSFGMVWKAKHKLTKITRAMKKIQKKGFEDIKKIEKLILNEVAILKKMDHPSIVKIFEVYSINDGYYLITEYCKGGELYQYILDYSPFSEVFTGYIIQQILSAMFYCHKQGIVHRDLKPENILIESENNGFLNIKIIDFGTAKIIETNKNEKKIIGTNYYLAPEVLGHNYNEKCDLWSCGVIMYIMLSGRAPFTGQTDLEIFPKIKYDPIDLKEKPWNKISKEAKNLLARLLERNPDKRLSAREAIEHVWFKKLKIKELSANLEKEKIKRMVQNLKCYKSNSNLQEITLAFLVHNSLHLEEAKDTYKMFKEIDENGDGQITKDELVQAFRKIFGVDEVEDEVDEIFLNVDRDNNGYIEFEELVRACIDKEKLLQEEILKFAFNFFDKDGSGDISIEELKQVFCKDSNNTKENNELLEDMIKDYDEDGNGEIDFDEFKDMMRKIIK